jgi:hypothetical protein
MATPTFLRAKSATGFVLPLLLVASIFSSILLSYMPGGNLINLGIAGALAGLTIIYLIVGRRELWIGAEVGFVLLWLGYALIPSIFALNQEQAMFKAVSMMQVMLLTVVTVQICIWNKSTKAVIWAFIVAVTASYLLTFTEIIDLITEIQVQSEKTGTSADSLTRTASTLGNANTFGIVAVLAQALVVLVLSIKSSTLLERVFSILCFFVLAGGVINSGSRTALVGMILLILGMAWVFSLWRLQNLGSFIKWFTIIAVLMGGTFYIFKDNEMVQDRYQRVFIDAKLQDRVEDFINLVTTSGDDKTMERSGSSLEDRVGLAVLAWDTANDHPFGVGLDNFSEYSGVYAHSNYLELLATTGFIGVLIYYLSYAVIVFKSLKLWVYIRRNALPKALVLGMAVLAMMDIANVSYYGKPVWIFLGIMIATAELLRRQTVATRMQGRQEITKNEALNY